MRKYVTVFLHFRFQLGPDCNDKKMECVDVMMMFIDKLGRVVYRHPR